ncbi:NADH dehydrogenase [ubiquinone] 1 beta subcomplex subunit 7 [Fragariocoptes setiger]|uniref:NADH dehydrogenase [ubiquinone] 1 beta subcomplex subunit 7 n=1 Tax=Fragariocoptes setiger TaxID=1670756 RepID=A0ABQ7SAJ1_9ACAR|nr:NADH dehydrogenase [ubiquinone] 1 beta subcomplex subunit 7 [Fragariocoptes setiger]
MGASMTIGALDDRPDPGKPSPYDPLYGFPRGRKKRELGVTEEEMNSVGLDDDQRDYCSKEKVELKACIRNNAPLWYRCYHQKHAIAECYYQDHIHNMKEYERERRLAERQRRIAKKKLMEG